MIYNVFKLNTATPKKQRFGFLGSVFLFYVLTFVSTVNAALISMGVGRVSDWVVTSREVMACHLVEIALYKYVGGAKKKLPAATINLGQVRDREFIHETTSTLLEIAIFREAESFSPANGNFSAQVDTQKQLARSRLAKDPTWRKLRISDQELERIIRRKLRAKDFLKFKMESAGIPISDREAEEYFNNNRNKFENLPFSSFRENIKAYLTKQQADRRLKDWFELLQTKYRVRNFLSE